MLGVDGCPKGWFMIKYKDDNYTFGVYENIQELIDENRDSGRILIDMPIGLSSKSHKRTIDVLLRKELKGRSSTVFNAPCREAVYKIDPDESKQKNLMIEGKSLSIQSLSLREKIRQIDEYLQKTSREKIEIIESHPELCFKYLNTNHEILQTKKSTKKGIDQRLTILKKYEPRIEQIFKNILMATKRKEVRKDDVVDALCLCIVNRLGENGKLSFLVDENRADNKQIKIKIGFYKKNETISPNTT
jgi:8-oxo-dGTP diphosphatase